MSARIVLATWGSYGDVNPVVGLALELKARGHTPVVVTMEHYREYVTREEIEFRPLRPALSLSDRELVARIIDARRGTDILFREILFPALRDAHADIAAAAEGAELLVSHPTTPAAPIVAEERGLRWASMALAPISFFSSHDLPVFPPAPALKRLERIPGMARLLVGAARAYTRRWGGTVRRLRAERGLPPGGNPVLEGQHSPYLVLALFTRLLATPQPDWPRNVRLTGPVWYNGPQADTLSPELEAFLAAGPAPVVFTLGSAAVASPGRFYEESVKAARRAGLRAVLLVGEFADNRPASLVDGDDVLVLPHAPHAALMPRAAVTVHPCGIGTLQQAMRAGRPMLLVPHAHDQPDNAWRARRLGVGVTIAPWRYRARRVAAALRDLTTEPAFAERAAAARDAMRVEDGVANACDAIEELLARN